MDPLGISTILNKVYDAVKEKIKVTAEIENRYAVTEVIIPLNGTQSSEIDFRNYKYLAFQMPAAWTAATITIKGSAEAGGTKRAISDESSFELPAIAVAVDKIYAISTNALALAGVHFLQLEASAAQAAARTIKVMLKA